MRVARRVSGILGMVLSALCVAASPARAQNTIEGRVIDTADARLPDVTIELVGIASVQTDSLGVYRVRGVPAQTVIIRVRKLGYAPTTRIITLSDGETHREDFELAPGTAMLAPVVTTARVTTRLHDPSGFERRRDGAIGGTYVTEEQIVASQVTRTEQLFERFGYMRVGSGGVVGAPVSGASGSPLPPPPPPKAGRASYGARASGPPGRCNAAVVFVDGTLVGDSFDINTIPPGSIRGIEMYRGPATTPAELRSYGTICGTVAVWTK